MHNTPIRFIDNEKNFEKYLQLNIRYEGENVNLMFKNIDFIAVHSTRKVTPENPGGGKTGDGRVRAGPHSISEGSYCSTSPPHHRAILHRERSLIFTFSAIFPPPSENIPPCVVASIFHLPTFPPLGAVLHTTFCVLRRGGGVDGRT